jgi:hypothetical protein
MGMSKRTLATVAIGMALIGPAQAQRSSQYDVLEDTTVTRTLSFAADGGRTLDVRNINGFIRVEATSDSAVQMSIHKVIRAETRDDLAAAQRDVRLEFRDGAPRVEAIVADHRGHVCGQEWNDRGDDRWDRIRYNVRFDFTIRVPRDVALRLCTINSGEVIVNGTRGDFDVTNVNGLIEMREVAASSRGSGLTLR